MNTKDIRTSTDPDLAGSFAAMERAARAAYFQVGRLDATHIESL